MFAQEIIDKMDKKKRVNYFKDQLQMAECFRIALSKHETYIRWCRGKEREIWKLTTSEEDKEKQAMEAWDSLLKKQNGDK